MNFILQIIENINNDKWYGVSHEIELMKGKNKLNKTRKERMEQMKRDFYFHKNN